MIHMRDMPFKCNLCLNRFSQISPLTTVAYSDELRYHSLTCTDSSRSWQGFAGFGLQVAPGFSPSPEAFHASAIAPLQLDASTPFLNPARSMTACPSPPSGQDDQAFTTFMSCLVTPPVDGLEGALSFDQYETLEGAWEDISRKAKNMDVPPATASRIRPRSRYGSQPYSGVDRRKNMKEKPAYTRRQVDDMLNVVSNCFAGTMKEVLKRVDVKKAGDKAASPAKDTIAADNPHDVLRKVLTDTLPRLYDGLQSFLDEKTQDD
ncbi:hypothetical protein DXG01_005535 [Tephrocybe rancida]|nr:hypothetical protein DXG01_005535 [Tephrocybe rancida]